MITLFYRQYHVRKARGLVKSTMFHLKKHNIMTSPLSKQELSYIDMSEQTTLFQLVQKFSKKLDVDVEFIHLSYWSVWLRKIKSPRGQLF